MQSYIITNTGRPAEIEVSRPADGVSQRLYSKKLTVEIKQL
jgi:hypothetical protein